MDGLLGESPARERYVYRLGRAVLLLALGAVMHLPSQQGSGILPPAVSPRPFVRVAAQQADSPEAPAVIVAHSLVYATLPGVQGIIQASDTTSNVPAVATAGLDEPPRAVALAEIRTADDGSTGAAEESNSGIEATTGRDVAKPTTPEKPLPMVAAPAADQTPVGQQAVAAPAIHVTAPPSAYRVPPIVAARSMSEEEDLVRRLLDEYTGAFERRDVGATKALYPNVNGKALKRAYEQISSQRLTLESCGITISGSTANARCRGSATFQPRIGTRPVQIASREWTFDLSKQDTSWRIVNTYVR